MSESADCTKIGAAGPSLNRQPTSSQFPSTLPINSTAHFFYHALSLVRSHFPLSTAVPMFDSPKDSMLLYLVPEHFSVTHLKK